MPPASDDEIEQGLDGAEARRLETALAALAQMTATAEAFRERLEAANQGQSTAELSATRMDGLARETLRDAEAGRVRIAHELHDRAAQGMVSAHRFLEAAEGALARDRSEQAAAYIEAAHTGLMAAIGDVRRVLNTLVPPGLEELGVANALQIHVRDQVPAGIAASVTGSLPRAEGWLEARLFAMAAEAIRNAVMHARPTSIRIALSALRGTAIITVGDDGAGFDPAAAPRQTEEGMGLIGMARQASWVGGQVDIASVLGEGTTVRITVPLSPPGGTLDIEAATGRGAR
jgi:signal transduction histidine kinase